MSNTSLPPFFKVLVNDFTRELKLPPYLVLKHENILLKYMKLRTSNGGMWDVKISKTEDGSCYLARGWSEFVKDTELVEKDYVCFYPDADGVTLDVVVFGENCCEKEMPVFDSKVNHEHVPSLHFELLLKDWQTPRLPLRKEFVKRAGLLGKKQVTLEYEPTKKTSTVTLDDRSKGGFKVELALGWHDFLKENGIEVGRIYLFTFNKARNVIQIEPVKNLAVHVAVVGTDSSESAGSDDGPDTSESAGGDDGTDNEGTNTSESSGSDEN